MAFRARGEPGQASVGRRLRRTPEPPGFISADFLAALASQVDDLVGGSSALQGLRRPAEAEAAAASLAKGLKKASESSSRSASGPTSARLARAEDGAEPDEETSPRPGRAFATPRDDSGQQLQFKTEEKPMWSKRQPERSHIIIGPSLFSEPAADEALPEKSPRSISPVEVGNNWRETLEFMERKREWVRVEGEKKLQEEMRGYTGRPVLAARSRKLVKDNYVRPWEAGRERPMSRRGERLQQMMEEKEEGEVREATFRPELCQRSRAIFKHMGMGEDDEWHHRVQRRRVVARKCGGDPWEEPLESRPWITPMARKLQREGGEAGWVQEKSERAGTGILPSDIPGFELFQKESPQRAPAEFSIYETEAPAPRRSVQMLQAPRASLADLQEGGSAPQPRKSYSDLRQRPAAGLSEPARPAYSDLRQLQREISPEEKSTPEQDLEAPMVSPAKGLKGRDPPAQSSPEGRQPVAAGLADGVDSVAAKSSEEGVPEGGEGQPSLQQQESGNVAEEEQEQTILPGQLAALGAQADAVTVSGPRSTPEGESRETGDATEEGVRATASAEPGTVLEAASGPLDSSAAAEKAASLQPGKEQGLPGPLEEASQQTLIAASSQPEEVPGSESPSPAVKPGALAEGGRESSGGSACSTPSSSATRTKFAERLAERSRELVKPNDDTASTALSKFAERRAERRAAAEAVAAAKPPERLADAAQSSPTATSQHASAVEEGALEPAAHPSKEAGKASARKAPAQELLAAIQGGPKEADACPPGIAALSSALRAHVLPRSNSGTRRPRQRTPPGASKQQSLQGAAGTQRRGALHRTGSAHETASRLPDGRQVALP